jgi:hypothetical protein
VSHWAEIDNTNTVIRVLVGDNNDPAGDEGYQWLLDNLGGTWIKTSYNGKIRGIYAGEGFTYNEAEDIFITPQPYPSWIREGSYWNSPIPCPTDEKLYFWNEENQSWDLIDEASPE